MRSYLKETPHHPPKPHFSPLHSSISPPSFKREEVWLILSHLSPRFLLSNRKASDIPANEFTCICVRMSLGVCFPACLVTKDLGISRSASGHFLVPALFGNAEPAGFTSEFFGRRRKGLGKMRLHPCASCNCESQSELRMPGSAWTLSEGSMVCAPCRKYPGEFCVAAMFCKWWTWKGWAALSFLKMKATRSLLCPLCFLVLCFSFLNRLFISLSPARH